MASFFSLMLFGAALVFQLDESSDYVSLFVAAVSLALILIISVVVFLLQV